MVHHGLTTEQRCQLAGAHTRDRLWVRILAIETPGGREGHRESHFGRCWVAWWQMRVGDRVEGRRGEVLVGDMTGVWRRGGGMGEMSTVEILGGSGPFYRGGMAWEVGRRG
jgi:hypothetical protein